MSKQYALGCSDSVKLYEIVAVRSTHREIWKCYEIEWKPLKEPPPPRW